MFLPQPVVIGVRMTGALPAGTTATDLVLTLTEMLRAHGVVGKFVEFFGDGLSSLSIADRATLSNMCPEYGATAVLLPGRRGDDALPHLHRSGRSRRPGRALHEGTGAVPSTTATPSRRSARSSSSIWRRWCRRWRARSGRRTAWRSRTCGTRSSRRSATTSSRTRRRVEIGRFVAEGGTAAQRELPGGDGRRGHRRRATSVRAGTARVVIAAITSCTNTSNPIGDGGGRAAGAKARRGRAWTPSRG